MSLLSKGIAHVSFRGGGMCLPARNPYDRQLLAEQVATQARSKGTVQILLDDDRWVVHTQIGVRVECVECGRQAVSACYCESHPGAHCVVCAVGKTGSYVMPAQALRRSAS